MTKRRPVIGAVLADGERLTLACCAAAGVAHARQAMNVEPRRKRDRGIITPWNADVLPYCRRCRRRASDQEATNQRRKDSLDALGRALSLLPEQIAVAGRIAVE